MNRRSFLRSTAAVVLGTVAARNLRAVAADASNRTRRMTMDFVWGAVGVNTDQRGAIELAAKHGFESVGADGGFLANLAATQLSELQEVLRAKGLKWGAAGLPVEFRSDEQRFRDSMRGFEKFASGLQRAGVERVGTWLTPSSDALPYVQNFRQHAKRLREAARVLGDHGCRLGLEYVGPRTSWVRGRYTFIHTLGELRDLIGEINTGNVGVVLDSWHWWHAGDTVQDVLRLENKDIVAVDLNDAPAGVPKAEQSDNRRELPVATGVIDVRAFLEALVQIGYDGPVRAEPFNEALNRMDNEAATGAVAAAMKKAFALLEG